MYLFIQGYLMSQLKLLRNTLSVTFNLKIWNHNDCIFVLMFKTLLQSMTIIRNKPMRLNQNLSKELLDLVTVIAQTEILRVQGYLMSQLKLLRNTFN